MSYYITAIYDHGLLKPLEPLVLPDQSRVRLRVEFDEMPKSSDNSSAESSAAEVVAQRQAMLEVDAEIADLPDLSPDDGFSSGDHDRILYGEAK
jgi:predicted DNA-binding antitoxin AbrB/MazE fold protein